jgi:tyrosine-specific transport protein
MYKKRGESKVYRGFFAKNKLLIAITTLVGTIVGAGILGIPYVVAKTGFVYGFFLMVLIGVAFLYLNLFAGEVVLRTKKQHQLTGYAEKYLGKTGKHFMTLSMLVNIYGALTAYLIGEGTSLYTIFKVGSPMLFTILFFVVAFLIVYRGIKSTGRTELILISLMFLVVLFVGIFSIDKINIDYFRVLDLRFFFLPYGVILFAFMATPAIPELQEELGNEKEKMKKAIVIGSITPIVLYLVFTFVVMGVVGLENFELLQPNERIATVALSLYSHPVLGVGANILAILAMFTSFLTLGIALIEMYRYDYGFSHRFALLLTFGLPLLIVFLNLTSFIVVLGLTGAIAGGLDGILVTLMYWKAKKMGDRKPEYSLKPYKGVGTALIFMFVLGILYQLWVNFF